MCTKLEVVTKLMIRGGHILRQCAKGRGDKRTVTVAFFFFAFFWFSGSDEVCVSSDWWVWSGVSGTNNVSVSDGCGLMLFDV